MKLLNCQTADRLSERLLIDEQSANDGVLGASTSEAQGAVATDFPDWISAAGKCASVARIELGPCDAIQYVDPLRPSGILPIQTVKRHRESL
jgi:hypothetical protein